MDCTIREENKKAVYQCSFGGFTMEFSLEVEQERNYSRGNKESNYSLIVFKTNIQYPFHELVFLNTHISYKPKMQTATSSL